MGMGDAYRAGYSIPRPFDKNVTGIQRGRPVAAVGATRAAVRGGSATRVGGAEEFYKYDEADRIVAKEKLDREQREKESVRAAGVTRYGQETARMTAETAAGISKQTAAQKAEDHAYNKSKLLRQDAFKAMQAEWNTGGDFETIKAFLKKSYMETHGVDPNQLELPYAQYMSNPPAWYREMMKAVPEGERTPDGHYSVTFPGQQPVSMSKQMIDGELIGKMNPAGQFRLSPEQQANIGKTEAETRKIDRGDLTEPEKLAREKFEWEKKLDTEAGLTPEYSGAPADSAQTTIPEGWKEQINRKTGKRRVVPITGGGGGIAKPIGADNTQTDLEKITQFTNDLGTYLDSHPAKLTQRQPPGETGPTDNVSGVGRTITYDDMVKKLKGSLDSMHQTGQTGIYRDW